MDAIDTLSQNLQGARGDWASIETIFSDHVASHFLNDLIAQEIGSLAKDFGHIVRMSVGQAHLLVVNTADFEYSIRILAPYPRRSHPVKWLGMRQIIGVKVGGPVAIRKLMVPPRININLFEVGVGVDGIDMDVAAEGDVVASQSVHHILDIHEVSSPSIVEVLTQRRSDAELCWIFDHELKSLYAEQSDLTASRLSNVLELAHALGKPIPDDLIYLTLEPSRPYVALLALRSMLVSGHPEAFVQLHRAMESPSETLSQGAQRLFDSMTTTRGVVHAT
jgi:hypothetical protein